MSKIVLPVCIQLGLRGEGGGAGFSRHAVCTVLVVSSRPTDYQIEIVAMCCTAV